MDGPEELLRVVLVAETIEFVLGRCGATGVGLALTFGLDLGSLKFDS